MSSARETENRILGSLLGLAIGDALGMPIGELPVDATADRFGEIRDYHARNPGEEDEIPAGEFTDETETVLCIVESMTTNNGTIDPENINARLMFLVEGASQHWMPESMRSGIRRAGDLDGLVPADDSLDGSLAVAVRGVPVGLMHGVGAFDERAFLQDTRFVTRLSHGGGAQHQLVIDVAMGMISLVSGERRSRIEIGADLSEVTEQRQIIARLLGEAQSDRPFEEVVFGAVNELRPADSAGAIAGAFAGAKHGAGNIPQELIDGLGARVYMSLAAPWFYRTAVRRAGTLIDLRQV